MKTTAHKQETHRHGTPVFTVFTAFTVCTVFTTFTVVVCVFGFRRANPIHYRQVRFVVVG